MTPGEVIAALIALLNAGKLDAGETTGVAAAIVLLKTFTES